MKNLTRNKKGLITVILLLFVCKLQSQVLEIFSRDNELKTSELYVVLEKDSTIRHGSYEKYLDIPETGQKEILQRGQYESNKKIGIWNFYDVDGNTNLQYDFDRDSVTIYNGFQVDGFKVNRPLIYLGSTSELRHITSWALRIPSKAHDLHQSGKVIVEIKVDRFGQPSDYTIKKGINEPLNEEAIRVAKLIPNNWLPAIKNGSEIEYSHFLPINIQFAY